MTVTVSGTDAAGAHSSAAIASSARSISSSSAWTSGDLERSCPVRSSRARLPAPARDVHGTHPGLARRAAAVRRPTFARSPGRSVRDLRSGDGRRRVVRNGAPEWRGLRGPRTARPVHGAGRRDRSMLRAHAPPFALSDPEVLVDAVTQQIALVVESKGLPDLSKALRGGRLDQETESVPGLSRLCKPATARRTMPFWRGSGHLTTVPSEHYRPPIRTPRREDNHPPGGLIMAVSSFSEVN